MPYRQQIETHLNHALLMWLHLDRGRWSLGMKSLLGEQRSASQLGDQEYRRVLQMSPHCRFRRRIAPLSPCGSLESSPTTCTLWLTGGRSVAFGRSRWNRPASLGFRCKNFSRSGASRSGWSIPASSSRCRGASRMWRIASGCSNCTPMGCWRRRFVKTMERTAGRRVCCVPTCDIAACSSNSSPNTFATCRRR